MNVVVPIMADMSGKVGVKGVCALVYGQQLPDAYRALAQLSFSTQAALQNVPLPTVKLIPQNATKPFIKRGRKKRKVEDAEQRGRGGQTKAYSMIGGRTINEINNLYRDRPQLFDCRANLSTAKFRDRLMPFVTDFYGAGVISSVNPCRSPSVTRG